MKKSFLIKREIIDKTLKNKPSSGSKLLEPFKEIAEREKLPFKILEDGWGGGDAEIHLHEHDLWFCIEGSVEFTYGGHLVGERFRIMPDKTESKHEKIGDSIEDGVTETLQAGDWLWIPAGEPHKHKAEKVARLMIIKLPVTI